MLHELQTVQRFFIYLFLAAIFTLGWLLKVFPFFKSVISIVMCKMTPDTSLPTEVYWDSLFTWKMFQNVYHCLLADINKRVKPQGKAYNSPVVSIDGNHYNRLLDFAKGSRPLVLNFGSSTCPVFMEMLKKYRQLKDQFSDIADFAVVYIEEAHPVDGWAFKGTSEIPVHRTQEERCRAAQKMATSIYLSGFYVAVDTMLNCANIAYGAVPIRLYVVQNKTVVYAGGAGPMKYRMYEVMLWLQDYRVNTMLSQSETQPGQFR